MIIISPQLFFSSSVLQYDEYILVLFFLFSSTKGKPGTLTRCCIAFLSRKFDSTSSPPFFFPMCEVLFSSSSNGWGLHLKSLLPTFFSILVYLISWPQLWSKRNASSVHTSPFRYAFWMSELRDFFYGCRARNLARLTLPQNCQFMCNFLIEKHTFCVFKSKSALFDSKKLQTV